MPRRSAASFSTFSVTGLPPRLPPPAELGDRERVLFLDLVTSLPASHFQPSDLPLLARYCEATALAERAAAALQDGAVVDGKVSPWVTVHGGAIKAMIGLSLRLRLSPQARAPNTPRRPVTVSYYERAHLESLGKEEHG